MLSSAAFFPSMKVLHWATVCFVAHEARATAQQWRYANS